MLETILVIIHAIIAVVLTAIVLMQHGKQQGLSGAIAGGAETFFGKNKGRTIDAMLKKVTAVMAILFVVSSVVLTAVTMHTYNAENAGSTTDGSQTMNVTMDENGNLVDENGNIVMTAEDMAAQEAAAGTTEDGTTTDGTTTDGATDATTADGAAAEDTTGAEDAAAEDTTDAAAADGTTTDEAAADDGTTAEDAPADEAAAE
ncbi:MAG TPA: preprotein translocase subunit SecG [Firmicutes bacterium]|nr:preprotein translocase subunit SecG [Bacillota bacterium]